MAWGHDRCAACDVYCDLSDHHCDPKKLARLEAGRKAADTRREEGTQTRNYSTRLTAGFGLLAMAGDR